MAVNFLPRANLEQVRVFHALALSGSVSGAARLLSVTEPAISYGVKKLEERLGVKLFKKSGRRNLLSEEGELLFKATQAAFLELSGCEAKLEAFRQLQSGALRLGIPQLMMHELMIPVIRAFHARHPGIAIDVRIENRLSRILDDLQEGRTDCMLVTLPDGAPLPEGLEVLTLGRFSYSFAADRELFPELEHREVKLEELAAYPLITLDRGHVAREALERAFEQRGLPFSPRFECETMALVSDFARAGLGLGLVITGYFPLTDPGLFILKLREPLVQGSLVLARKAGAPLSRAAAAFCELTASALPQGRTTPQGRAVRENPLAAARAS